ncbi:hypothetical protein [Cytophaga hutchinsonii]|nr:hypothetical protein [Cytophaga hutchinsonii]SFX06062.1 hypothetical protein SAMN04487930_101357 [Cytophaga hutchinsonii ATCC 33406]
MKKGFIILLVLFILLQSSIKSLYVAYYNINQDYIASVLCINKAKPASTCNGKCYLIKKMEQQEKQEQTIPSVLKGLEEVVLFCTTQSFAVAPVVTEIPQLTSLDAYQMHAYTSPADRIIQPPQ